uniref:Carboxylesterase type B domain-containing protein n=1 Tax=Cyprinus carpio TaxID=7962 RepID=A0A8C2ILG1_CYPCA
GCLIVEIDCLSLLFFFFLHLELSNLEKEKGRRGVVCLIILNELIVSTDKRQSHWTCFASDDQSLLRCGMEYEMPNGIPIHASRNRIYCTQKLRCGIRISEDCQYLSVWTPSTDFQNRAKPLVPFMVWIYGGGFSTGTASLDVYDGRFLIHSQQVVLVSMIYRVGALDFLSLPESKSIKGNVGLFNQCLALSWMARNIDAFGVGSVGHHLLSQGSHGLFTHTILQSGNPNAMWAAVDLQFDDISDPKIISVPFQPTVDGEFLVDMQSVLIQSGCFLKIELLLGLNRNQGTYFLVYGAPGFGIDNQSLINQDQFLTGVSMGLPGFSDIAREVAAFQCTDWTDEQYNGRLFLFNHRSTLSRRIMEHWNNFARILVLLAGLC